MLITDNTRIISVLIIIIFLITSDNFRATKMNYNPPKLIFFPAEKSKQNLRVIFFKLSMEKPGYYEKTAAESLRLFPKFIT